MQETEYKTFIDDTSIKVSKETDKRIEDTIVSIMEKIKEYTASNKLCLNPNKSKIMLISKNLLLKDKFEVNLNGKTVRHSKEIKLLGITINKDLMWDTHVRTNLIPQLSNQA